MILKVEVSNGGFSDLIRVISFLKTKFDYVETKIEIICRNGSLRVTE